MDEKVKPLLLVLQILIFWLQILPITGHFCGKLLLHLIIWIELPFQSQEYFQNLSAFGKIIGKTRNEVDGGFIKP